VVMLSLLAATLSWHRASVAESRRIAANALVDNLLNASDQELPSKLNGLRADLPNSADVLRTRLADSTLPARAKGRLQLAMLSPDTPMPIELWQAALVDAWPKECSLLLRPGVVPAESAADLLWRETEP